MAIKYYKLFDLLNRRGLKKTDLRKVVSSKTIAKLSKGENVTTDVINKICLFLECQPSDIMEIVIDSAQQNDNTVIYETNHINREFNGLEYTETVTQSYNQETGVRETLEITEGENNLLSEEYAKRFTE